MVSQPPHCFYAHIGSDAGQFLPQEAYVDLHMILHSVGIIAPHPGKQRLFRQVLLPHLQQQAHHVKFPCGQPHLIPAAVHYAGGKIQFRIAKLHLFHMAALAAQQGIDAGQQLPGVKRLRQIIVRAGVQALDSIRHIGFCGQHQNRHRAVLGAHPPCQLKTIQPRHHHVQYQQIVDSQLRILRPRDPVVGCFHLKSFGSQQCT